MMNRESQIAEEAAGWVATLNQPAFDAAAGRISMRGWRHRRATGKPSPISRHSGSRDALVQALGQVGRAPIPARQPSVSFDRFRRLRGLAPRLVATACAVLLAIVAILPLLSTNTYTTGAGRSRSVVLADGSRVDLSGDTELRVQILPWKRNAELIRGEAFFDVRHERARMFQVVSGTTSVRVLGTAFNVDRQSPTRTAVSVYRGAVKVGVAGQADLVLRRGDGARVVDGHVIAQPRIAASAPDWKSGWFEASDIPLGVLIGKVQRYSSRPIMLEDRTLQTLPISGRFHIADTDRVLQAVQAAYHVDVAYGPDTIVIRPADPGHDR